MRKKTSRIKANKSPSRHARRCNVCRHPDREAIEQDFLRWRSPERLAEDYAIADHSSIYRHVHATGIFALRRRNLRSVFELILEHADDVKVTAGDIVSAVRAYAHINDSGEWIEPPKHYIVTRTPSTEAVAAAPSQPSPLVTSHSPLSSSNRQPAELEHGSNP